MSEPTSDNRPLTPEEHRLILWMLEHGSPEAKQFVTQLELARVTPWRCGCGCASINLVIDGHPEPSAGTNPIADFIFGSDEDEDLNGIFVFEQDGVLGGVEVYGLPGDAAKSLPTPEILREFPPQQQSRPLT